jgi:hypothetical protein
VAQLDHLWQLILVLKYLISTPKQPEIAVLKFWSFGRFGNKQGMHGVLDDIKKSSDHWFSPLKIIAKPTFVEEDLKK